MFKIFSLIGDLVKLRHINHLTITGVLSTIKPSVPQKVCLLNWLVKHENTGKVEFLEKVTVITNNIIYFQWVDIDVGKSGTILNEIGIIFTKISPLYKGKEWKIAEI